MRNSLSYVTAAALLVTSIVAGPAAAATYDVDAVHSNVSFKIRHFVSKVDGRFTDFGGAIVYDPAKAADSSVRFTVQAESINTDNEKRDGHLRSEDFFHVEEFPTLEFTSTSVEPIDDDSLQVTGDLTIRGVTKRVTLPVEILGVMEMPQGAKAGFETGFTIDRKEYDIVWNRALDQGGAVLGDDVEIRIQVEANRQQEAPAAGSQGD